MKTLPENAIDCIEAINALNLSEMSKLDSSIMEQSLQKMFDDLVVFISKTDFE